MASATFRERLFRALLARRRLVLAGYAVVLPLALLLALRVPTDNGVDRLIVESDPDYQATRAFQQKFPEGMRVLLVLEAPDPYAPAVLAAVADLEGRLGRLPGVEAFSALTVYRRVRPDFTASPDQAEDFRRFATGTRLFRRQGLAGDTFLGLPLELRVPRPEGRDRVLRAIDEVLRPLEGSGIFRKVRRLGDPYVDAWLEDQTGRKSLPYFALFGAFVVALNLVLYRSARTLVAFLLTLAVAVGGSVGLASLLGFGFTIVSSLVPLTVLVTATANLVYVHSRFVDNPEGAPFDEHLVRALANKFVPCTASIFAAAVGFAALAVSAIRPIREMGIWVGCGLAFTWLVVFTLFPCLQKTLRTPMRHERETAGRRLRAVAHALPGWTYRGRFGIVAASLLLCLAGLLALTGFPGVLPGMPLETDRLAYVDPGLPLADDIRWFERSVAGLSVSHLWIRAPEGGILDPEVLRALAELADRLEADERVSATTGPTTTLRFLRYVGGQGDRLPQDPSAWPKLAGDLEQLLLREKALRDYVDVGTLGDARLTVLARDAAFGGFAGESAFFAEAWRATVARHPALAGCSMRVVGQALLESKISDRLVPTLAESFVLTAAVIFVAFLVVFRSGTARLLAMIPSVFAILVMFLVMRVFGISLNVATILIASTVLGASENDQIHFFYHYLEGRRLGPPEAALRHTLIVAGRAILFATLINAGGFLALALSDLPPMRQFGIVAASAFLLSMLADFTALPAALWILSRERPSGAQ